MSANVIVSIICLLGILYYQIKNSTHSTLFSDKNSYQIAQQFFCATHSISEICHQF